MNQRKPRVLAIDDEVFNLDILQNDLEDAGFEVMRAEDGATALVILKGVHDIDVIVLDRMMPGMDGLQLTKKLKEDPQHRHIPIIMQTAAGQSQQVREGVAAGVYYYLIKPYNETLLTAIVKNALGWNKKEAEETARRITPETNMSGLMEHANMRFRTLQDVSNVAYYIANCCPKPDSVLYGLSELMINAVEHGNLNITYTEKRDMVLGDCWQQEVAKRLALPQNQDKYATLSFATEPKHVTITIKDQGRGFKWQEYMDFDPLRMASDPHGKGIAITRVTSFPLLEYRQGGSEVVCRIPR